MSRVITYSRTYPSYHPRAGEHTYFVEKIWLNLPIQISYKLICDLNPNLSVDLKWKFWRSINHDIIEKKYHTIRAGNRWKVGDWFSPRVWSGKPYDSKQIIIAPDITVKKVWDFEIKVSPGHGMRIWINNNIIDSDTENRLFLNDGLSKPDFLEWFKFPKKFDGQIICWDESINY